MQIGKRTKTMNVDSDEIHIGVDEKHAMNLCGSANSSMIWAWCINGDSGPHGIQMPVREVLDAIDALIKKKFRQQARRKK